MHARPPAGSQEHARVSCRAGGAHDLDKQSKAVATRDKSRHRGPHYTQAGARKQSLKHILCGFVRYVSCVLARTGTECGESLANKAASTALLATQWIRARRAGDPVQHTACARRSTVCSEVRVIGIRRVCVAHEHAACRFDVQAGSSAGRRWRATPRGARQHWRVAVAIVCRLARCWDCRDPSARSCDSLEERL